jgi:hypothetical protein
MKYTLLARHTDLSATCNKTLFSVFGMFVTTTESLWHVGWERRTEGEKAVREGRAVGLLIEQANASYRCMPRWARAAARHLDLNESAPYVLIEKRTP